MLNIIAKIYLLLSEGLLYANSKAYLWSLLRDVPYMQLRSVIGGVASVCGHTTQIDQSQLCHQMSSAWKHGPIKAHLCLSWSHDWLVAEELQSRVSHVDPTIRSCYIFDPRIYQIHRCRVFQTRWLRQRLKEESIGMCAYLYRLDSRSLVCEPYEDISTRSASN